MQTPPKLVLTSQDAEFDPVTIRNWHAEGFKVTYLPYTGTQKEFERALQLLPDSLELGEKYAIVGLPLPLSKFCVLYCLKPDADRGPRWVDADKSFLDNSVR